VAMPLAFLKDLHAAVQAGLADGLSLEQMQEQITLEEYSDWAYYERLRPKNIEAAYHNLVNYRY